MEWKTDHQRSPIRERTSLLSVDGRLVPVVLWTPMSAIGRVPLVLISHGGSGHKTTPLVTDLAWPLVERHGFAVAAIDGPVHGERRADWDPANPPQGSAIRDQFFNLWRTGTSVDEVVEDWRDVLDELIAMPEIDSTAIGWYGLSMGTAYGLPLCAADERIRVAVLGLWGADYPASERLVADAPKVQCAVQFHQKWSDELFSKRGQLALFDRIGSTDKRHRIYLGEHGNPVGEQLADIEEFLVNRLNGCRRGEDTPALSRPTIVTHADRPLVDFNGGATYRAIIGDDTGEGIPVRTGYQYSPPGYQVEPHSHPYPEILTVIEGRGEAWFVGGDHPDKVALEPGATIIFPAGRVHCFRTVGEETLVTLGIHAFGKRVVQYAGS
ncbi:MAG: cupin domain-containing protein [Betaproteobacteria bacterium]|nr:cupin domain-containing protein [Betaproteobacteria bacterium]